MPRTRDPSFVTGHLCRFCGELVPWGTIQRLIRVDPDTPGYMLNAARALPRRPAAPAAPGGRADLLPPLGRQGAAA